MAGAIPHGFLTLDDDNSSTKSPGGTDAEQLLKLPMAASAGAISRIIKQVDPDIRVTKEGLLTMVDLTHWTLRKLVRTALDIASADPATPVTEAIVAAETVAPDPVEKDVLSARRIESAVRSVIPGQLGDYAIEDAARMLAKWTAADEEGRTRIVEVAPADSKQAMQLPVHTTMALAAHVSGLAVPTSAAVYLGTALSYLAGELVELVFECAKAWKAPAFLKVHVGLCILNDTEFSEMFKGSGIAPEFPFRGYKLLLPGDPLVEPRSLIGRSDDTAASTSHAQDRGDRPTTSEEILQHDEASSVPFILTDDVLVQVFHWLDTHTLLKVVPAVCRSWGKVRSMMMGVALTLNPATGGLFTESKLPPYSPQGQQLIASLAEKFASVAVLDLSDTPSPQHYWHRASEADETKLSFVPKLFPKLAFIRLRRCQWVGDKEVLFLADIPSIIGVDVFRAGYYGADAVLQLIERKPHLRALGCGGVRAVDNESIAAIASGCSALSSAALRLADDPADLMPLGKHRTTLKSLTVDGTFDAAVFEAIPNLTHLTFDGQSLEVRTADVEAAVKWCPRLQCVSVKGQPSVDTLRWVEESRRVPGLGLKQCTSTSSGRPEWNLVFVVNTSLDPCECVGNFPRWLLETLLQGHPDLLKRTVTHGLFAATKALFAIGAPPSADLMKIATVNGYPDVVEALIEANVAVDEPWVEGGSSALTVATYYGHLDVMRVLLAHGAGVDFESVKNDGEDPMTVALKKRRGDSDALKLLGLQTPLPQKHPVRCYPTEAAMRREVYTHLRVPMSAIALSQHDGIGDQWFSNQRDVWDGRRYCHVDCCDVDLHLVKTDLVHRSFSELPESVQGIATHLDQLVADVTVGAGDGDSRVKAVVFSGDTSKVYQTCLCALGIKRPAWRWAYLSKKDYSSKKFFFSTQYSSDDDDDYEDAETLKAATKVLADSLVEHFEFSFSDPPVYICPKLYGGRHKESGCLIALLVTRDHGD